MVDTFSKLVDRAKDINLVEGFVSLSLEISWSQYLFQSAEEAKVYQPS